MGKNDKLKSKKIIFTVVYTLVLLLALWWTSWLCFYFTATIDGLIPINSAYYLFERNYLVPVQIFGITVLFSALTMTFYRKLRKKEIIGRKYMILAIFSTVPFWFLSICQIDSMVSYWNQIY